jgi:hypothetical protein
MKLLVECKVRIRRSEGKSDLGVYFEIGMLMRIVSAQFAVRCIRMLQGATKNTATYFDCIFKPLQTLLHLLRHSGEESGQQCVNISEYFTLMIHTYSRGNEAWFLRYAAL